MFPLVNPRNYFFPVIQSVRLAENLSGSLVYVEHQLGSKSTNTPQCGLFLFQTTHEAMNPSDDHFMQEEYTLFESWWQADVPFDAPYETKLQTYQDTGVLWLDNDALSLYILTQSQHPDSWYLRNEYSRLESWFANHTCQQTQHMVEHYLSALRCDRPEYQLLRDYLNTISPNLYTDILTHIATHLGEMYHDKLTIVGMPSTDGFLTFLANLVAAAEPQYWWQCYDQSYYATSSQREEVEWRTFSIEPMIIAMLAAQYWREHPDFTRTDAIPMEALERKFPLELREWLWTEYLKLHRYSIFTMLSNRDDCEATPTEDDIKAELLREEQTKPYLYPEHLLPFRSRVQVFRKQFLRYLGYTEPEATIEEDSELKTDPYEEAVRTIAAMTDDDGRPLIHFKNDWYPVFLVLAQRGLFLPNQFREGAMYLARILGPDNSPSESVLSKFSSNIILSANLQEWRPAKDFRPSRFEKVCRIRDSFKRLLP